MPPAENGAIRAQSIRGRLDGYGCTAFLGAAGPDSTTEEYALDQQRQNVAKTRDFILPIVRGLGASRVLDAGCGVGTMVKTLRECNVEAYGVDLPGLVRHWRIQGFPVGQLFVIDPMSFELPFHDGALDFVFSLGVIEHVGTTDGHSTRRPDYHDIRRQWLRELFRCVRPGGSLLIGGPNRNFPVDVAHGPDACAPGIARWFHRRFGATVHRTWGENFLWGYRDLHRYLGGCRFSLQALSVDGYVGYSRVPRLVRPLVEGYVRRLPNALLESGFNPWVMALIRKDC